MRINGNKYDGRKKKNQNKLQVAPPGFEPEPQLPPVQKVWLLTTGPCERRLKSLGTVTIRINDSRLEEASSFKYLSVTLSEDLSWADHVKNIMSKENQRLGLVRRIKHLLPLHARLKLYHSLILPLFDYGGIFGGDKNNATLMNDLQIQQTKAAKIFLDKAKYSSARDALEILKWKRLDHRQHMHRSVFNFRCLNDIIDFDFNFKCNSALHNYNTRQCNKLHPPAPKAN